MPLAHVTEDSITPDIRRKLSELDGPAMRQTLAEIGREFVSITKDNFGPEQKPGRPAHWPALSPVYQRKIKYFGPPKLIFTGRLRESIQIEHILNNSVTVGTDVPYAAIHQFGGTNYLEDGTPVEIPARPYFPVERDISSWDDYKLTPYAATKIRQILEMKFR